MIEEITYNKKILAIILRSRYKQKGIKFFTPNSFSQQLGYMNRPKGYHIQPHIHKKNYRKVQSTNEALFIKSGIVRVDFYNNKKNYLKSKILKRGDVILLIAGGHGFKMLRACQMIEVKQGPYSNNKDKVIFRSVVKKKIKAKY
jgi:hypothetical protein